MAAVEDTSLKSLQVEVVQRMLTLNDVTNNSSTDQQFPSSASMMNQWKVLIYDKPCRTIISPILSVSQLRSRGVTLHMLIDSDRDPIPDVPAVYFVEPTRENLAIIAQDCAKRLYERVHLNFVSKLDRSLMEELARLVVQSNSLDMIASVHDQYLDFVCMEKNLFSLSNKSDSYALINGSKMTEDLMDKYMEEIAYGLFSVVGTSGCIPVIRCPKGGATEMVARKLHRIISEHPSMSSSKSHLNRSLLVILDRNMDLITPVQHSSTYQALIDDLLDHNANRVEFTITSDNDSSTARGKINHKKIDLDPDNDPFYSKYKFSPFPEAIESNGMELQEVTNREKAIRSKTITTGTFSGDSDSGGSSSAASDLVSAVESLPVLMDRKKQLETHTSILQAVMNEVAARDVPHYYELESALAMGNYKKDHTKAKSEVISLVLDGKKGTVEDKVRLIIVYALATNAPASDVAELTKSIIETLNDVEKDKMKTFENSIKYVMNLRSLQMIPTIADGITSTSSTSSTNNSSGNTDTLLSFLSRATNQATGLLAKASERVSTMLAKVHKHHVTRVVENLCEMKPNTEDDDYLYLDPKVKGDVDVKAIRSVARSTPREIITFVIGGGCYAEYQNLLMLTNEKRKITYGSTELTSPKSFINQLGRVS